MSKYILLLNRIHVLAQALNGLLNSVDVHHYRRIVYKLRRIKTKELLQLDQPFLRTFAKHFGVERGDVATATAMFSQYLVQNVL